MHSGNLVCLPIEREGGGEGEEKQTYLLQVEYLNGM